MSAFYGLKAIILGLLLFSSCSHFFRPATTVLTVRSCRRSSKSSVRLSRVPWRCDIDPVFTSTAVLCDGRGLRVPACFSDGIGCVIGCGGLFGHYSGFELEAGNAVGADGDGCGVVEFGKTSINDRRIRPWCIVCRYFSFFVSWLRDVECFGEGRLLDLGEGVV